jgi:hypothetical protein
MSYQPPSQPEQQPQWGQQPSQPLPPQQGYPQQPQWQGQPQYPQPGAFQQPPQAKTPKKGLPWRWIIASLFIGAIIGYAAHVPPAQTTPTANAPQATQQATQAPAQPTATPKPTQPPHVAKWTTVQTFKGNGIKKTSSFTVPDHWRLLWSCDPASFGGSQYNLIVDVYNVADTSLPQDSAVNVLCGSSATHDSTELYHGGTVYLDINSEAAWALTVQVLK